MSWPPGSRKPPERSVMDAVEGETDSQALLSQEPRGGEGPPVWGLPRAGSGLATVSSGSFLSTSWYTLWSSSSPSLEKPGAETLISFQFGSHEGLLPVPWCLKGCRGGDGASPRPEPRVLPAQAGRAGGLAFGRLPNRLGCEVRMDPSYFCVPSGPQLWLPEPVVSRAQGPQVPVELL